METAEQCLIRLEYAVLFVKARDKHSRKVFHMKEREFPPGSHAIAKKHAFIDLSTRKHYQGQHRFEIIVNGIVKNQGTITLQAQE